MDDEEKDSLSITSGNTDITAGTTSLVVDDETSSSRGGATSSRHCDHPPLLSSLKPRPLSFHRRSSQTTKPSYRNTTSRSDATTTTVHEALLLSLQFTKKANIMVSVGPSSYEVNEDEDDWGSFVPFQ